MQVTFSSHWLLVSLGNLHLPDDVVFVPKLVLEAGHHIKRGVLLDMHGLTMALRYKVTWSTEGNSLSSVIYKANQSKANN